MQGALASGSRRLQGGPRPQASSWNKDLRINAPWSQGDYAPWSPGTLAASTPGWHAGLEADSAWRRSGLACGSCVARLCMFQGGLIVAWAWCLGSWVPRRPCALAPRSQGVEAHGRMENLTNCHQVPSSALGSSLIDVSRHGRQGVSRSIEYEIKPSSLSRRLGPMDTGLGRPQVSKLRKLPWNTVLEGDCRPGKLGTNVPAPHRRRCTLAPIRPWSLGAAADLLAQWTKVRNNIKEECFPQGKGGAASLAQDEASAPGRGCADGRAGQGA